MNLADSWSFVLFIICIIGARRIGRWEGSSTKKLIYRFLIPILSTILTFILLLNLSFVPAFENPLLYILFFTIIIHLLLKKPGIIWIQTGILPFSKEYPVKEKKDWKDMFYHERIFLVGTLLASIAFEIPLSDNSLTMFVRMSIFWVGIFAIVTSIYLKYSQPRLLVGFFSLIFGAWLMPVNQSYGIILFWVGIGFLIWGYLQIKKKRKDVLVETNE